MSVLVRGGAEKALVADRSFFDIFLPRELKLMQQISKARIDGVAERFLGLFLVRLEGQNGDSPSEPSPELSAKSRHLLRLITSTIRYYDIPGQLIPGEFFLVVREIEPRRAGLIANRLLGMVSRSRVLSSGGISLRVGYIVYPISIEPDLAPTDWPKLVELARHLSGPLPGLAGAAAETAGHGLCRGPEMGSPTIPEADIVNLAMTDLGSMIQAKLLILDPVTLNTP
jgi:hypothetical protein